MTPLLRLVLLSLVLLLLDIRTIKSDPDADLLKAAFSGDLAGVQAALQDPQVNPNVRDSKSGQTALMGSVLRGHASVVEYLLNHDGVDVTVPEKNGYTPAHGAGFQGRVDVMRLLYKAGINVVDDYHIDGYAPLHRACWGPHPRHAETVRMLRDEAGVPVDTLVSRPNGKPGGQGGTGGLTCDQMTQNKDTLDILQQKNVSNDKEKDGEEL